MHPVDTEDAQRGITDRVMLAVEAAPAVWPAWVTQGPGASGRDHPAVVGEPAVVSHCVLDDGVDRHHRYDEHMPRISSFTVLSCPWHSRRLGDCADNRHRGE